jgi:hypothetical protein
MKVRDGSAAQSLSTDEAYERFFDGYYNLAGPGEIFGRDVVMSCPKGEMLKPAAYTTDFRIGRTRGSVRNAARVK